MAMSSHRHRQSQRLLEQVNPPGGLAFGAVPWRDNSMRKEPSCGMELRTHPNLFTSGSLASGAAQWPWRHKRTGGWIGSWQPN